MDRRAGPRFGDVAVLDTSARYALLALQGPLAREVLQSLTGRRSLRPQVLLVHLRGSGGRAGDDLRGPGTPVRTATRSSRRRQQALRVWEALLAGRARTRGSCRRPRGARHAAARGGDAPLRQRHRRDDHRARGGPRVDRRLGEGGVQRAGRAGRRSGRRRCRAASSGSRWWTGRSLATAIRVLGRRPHRSGVVTSGTQTPFLNKAIGMAYVPSDRARAGYRVRDRRPWPPRPGARRAVAILQTSEGVSDVSRNLQVHDGPRVDRPGQRARGHHRLRAEAAGGHRVPRPARGGEDPQEGRAARHGGIGEGRLRGLRARCPARSSR